MDKTEYVGHISPILQTNFVIPERYQEFIEYENTILNWLDGQIRQSVAQEIIEELEEQCCHCGIDIDYYRTKSECKECYQAIKSRWVKE